MYKVNKPLMSVKIGQKMGPKNASSIEQKLWSNGYRCFGEKIIKAGSINWMKITNKEKQKMYRVRSWVRGKKCIKIGDMIENIPASLL